MEINGSALRMISDSNRPHEPFTQTSVNTCVRGLKFLYLSSKAKEYMEGVRHVCIFCKAKQSGFDFYLSKNGPGRGVGAY